MTISYPLTVPNNKWTRINWVEETGVVEQSSFFDGSTDVFVFDRNRWGITVSFDPMTPDEFAPWSAFLSKLRGSYGTFRLGSELKKIGRGVLSGTPLTAGATTFGSDTIAIDGVPNSVTNWAREDDRIQINDRLYKVLENANSNGSGQVTLTVWPKARTHADNQTVIAENARGLFRLVDESIQHEETRTRHHTLSFSAVEAL